MSPIKTVAVAGATGNLGPAIVEQLLKAGFDVTILTRPGSSHTFPSAAKVAHVDYSSVASLTATLRGQDAVVATFGPAGLEFQTNLLEAAIAAGVRRFIPSEFGSNTANAKAAALFPLAPKAAFRKVLDRKVAEPGVTLSYTGIVNGPFLDWGLRIGWLASLKTDGGSINIWDGGERAFSTSTLATVGRAVAAVLQHPDETKNRLVFVQDAVITPHHLSALAQRAISAKNWTENAVSTEDSLAQGEASIAKPGADFGAAAMFFINAAIFGEGYGSNFEHNDNAVLGLKELTDDGLIAVIKSVAGIV